MPTLILLFHCSEKNCESTAWRMLAISTPSVTEEGEGSFTPKQDDSHRRMASDDEEDMMDGW